MRDNEVAVEVVVVEESDEDGEDDVIVEIGVVLDTAVGVEEEVSDELLDVEDVVDGGLLVESR